MSYIRTSGNVGYQSLPENAFSSQYCLAVESNNYEEEQIAKTANQANKQLNQVNKVKASIKGKSRPVQTKPLPKLLAPTKNVLTMGKTAKDVQIMKMLTGTVGTTANGYIEHKAKSKGPNFKICSSKSKDQTRRQEQKNDSSNLNSINSLSHENTHSLNVQHKPMSFLEVFKQEKVDNCESAVSGHVKSNISKSNLTVVKSSNSGKSPRGRGPTVHEALQRLPNAKGDRKHLELRRKRNDDLRALLPSEWHAPSSPSELDDDRVLSSSEEETLPPCYSSFVWTELIDGGSSNARLSRLAARRAGLRRRLATAKLESDPSDKYHRIALLLQKDLNSRDPGSAINPALLDTILTARGQHNLLSGGTRRLLRNAGWSSDAAEVSGTTWGEGKALLDAVLSAQPEAEPSVPSESTHALSRPKKTPRRRNTSSRRNNKRKRINTHASNDVSVCSNSSTYESGDELPQEIGAQSQHPPLLVLQPGEGGTVVSAGSERCDSQLSNGQEHGIDVSLCASNNSGADDMLDTSVLQQIPDDAFTEFFNQENGSELGEPEELARALEAVLEDTSLTDVFNHRTRPFAGVVAHCSQKQ